MKIETADFDVPRGAQFKIEAENTTERVLLKACEDGNLLTTEDDCTFILSLEVSNK